MHRLPQPHCRRCALGLTYPGCDLACAQALEPMLAAHGEEICGLIVEPKVQGAAGMIVQPKGYLTRLADICRKHDVLFMADEVATGFGRTGRMFACELEGITPDIMTLGKGITGGVLPLAATLASDRVYRGLFGRIHGLQDLFPRSHLHGQSPGLRRRPGQPGAHGKKPGDRATGAAHRASLSRGLNEIAGLEHVVEVRQQGLMIGIEVARDKAGDVPYAADLRMGHQVIMACRQHGAIVRPLGDTVILMPPLASKPEELDLLLQAVAKAIVQVAEA